MTRFLYFFVESRVFAADLFRLRGKVSRGEFQWAIRNDPGFHFLFYFRIATLYSKYSLLGLLGRIMYRKLTFLYGYQIPRRTCLGRGLRISHFGPLVINQLAKIGDNCYVSHNVTIGKANRGDYAGCPIIGNRVWIGPGAVIVGGISIGNNVLIAPNSYVNRDIPSNSIVIGNPAIAIANASATEGYILHVFE